MPQFTAFLQALASVLSAVAWPAVLLIVAVSQKKRLHALADLLLKRLKSDRKVELWSLKLEAAVDEKLREAETGAALNTASGRLPPEQIALSRDLVEVVEQASDSSSSSSLIRSRVEDLAWEYEDIRLRLPPGSERTHRMTQVVAQLRTLALAGRELLPELRNSKSIGKRLAAVVFLQVRPRLTYLQWLADRLREEEQAFVLAQTALALLFLTRDAPASSLPRIRDELKRALEHVRAYDKGPPDPGTVDTLEQALRLAERT